MDAIESEEVFVARVVFGATQPSSRAKSSCFTFRFSATASITRSQSR
jgi:hypothetical protein